MIKCVPDLIFFDFFLLFILRTEFSENLRRMKFHSLENESQNEIQNEITLQK